MIARPKISQNDLDLTELESIKLWAGRPGSLFDFSTGSREILERVARGNLKELVDDQGNALVAQPWTLVDEIPFVPAWPVDAPRTNDDATRVRLRLREECATRLADAQAARHEIGILD